MRREFAALLLILLFTFSSSPLYGVGEFYSISSTEVTVFRDGVVLVKQRLVVNETFPSITVPLLATSDNIGNLLVLDQRGIPLNYELGGSNVTIHSLGASQVSLQYETQNLTKKQGSVWTIIFETSFNVTMILPEQSTIIFLSDLPSEITVNGTRPVLLLRPGRWEFSYVLPLPNVTTTTAVATTQPPPPRVPPLLTSPYVLGAAVIGGLGLFSYALIRSGRLRIRRRPVESEELRPEEKEVIQFISEKGGKVLEAELRTKFLLPKTSMWRMVRRLERRGLLRVRKVGVQNEIELVR